MYKLEEKTIKENVFMANELRIVINREAKRVYDVLLDYVGKKAFKTDGSLVKKIADKITFNLESKVPVLREGGFARIHFAYLSPGYNSLHLKIGMNWHGGSYDDKTYYCEYRDEGYWIADNKDSILSELKKIELPLIDENTELEAYNKAYDYRVSSNTERSKLLPIHMEKI